MRQRNQIDNNQEHKQHKPNQMSAERQIEEPHQGNGIKRNFKKKTVVITYVQMFRVSLCKVKRLKKACLMDQFAL